MIFPTVVLARVLEPVAYTLVVFTAENPALSAVILPRVVDARVELPVAKRFVRLSAFAPIV